MNKTGLIIKREYLTRVKKKSFIIMTILGPILMASVFIISIYVSQIEGDQKIIGIIDETGLFTDKFSNSENLSFVPVDERIETAKEKIAEMGLYALVYIPATELSVPQSAIVYSEKQPNINVTGYIKSTIRNEVEQLKLEASGIDPKVLNSIKTKINLRTVRINEGGEEESSYTVVSMIVGFAAAFFIYLFIFLYGAQVMRGVIEEKTNRIIEVMVSSVKPFQLMMGKIIGVAMVGFTQFVIWVIFTSLITTTFMTFYSGSYTQYQASQIQVEGEFNMLNQENNTKGQVNELKSKESETEESINKAIEYILSIDFPLIISMFLFYFIGGYLLYGALFAAIGSASDTETDTQQFMLPITIPLILSIVVSQFIIQNPDGPAAFWLSIFPFTSPVIMMLRIPFGIPVEQLILSMLLLVAGFFFTTWLAARIYRIGILMYGKKINYRELWKWIRYRH